ncbi:UPF0104 family protein [Clostridium tertium]|uniref:Phosphatidylglycerol lysyltransferase n=1 Tax=Clostridium tertium TaxID=1559 RepID=A0A6N2Z364_9CLOT
MLIKVEEKHKSIFKLLFICVVSLILVVQFRKLFHDFDLKIFYGYREKLTIITLSYITILGIFAYLPLSLYDFVIKETCEIKLDNKKLYKSSWIASSISSIVGFGGTAAIALKSYLYSPYIKDKTTLVKEVSKVVLLNFTGFSTLCLLYLVFYSNNINFYKPVNIGILIAGLYTPILLIYNLLRFRNNKDKNYLKTIKIMSLSIIEWTTMAFLLFSILKILGANITLTKVFPIYVVSTAIGIVSMMPGGLGGFDLSFIIGLTNLGINKEEVLLALLLYRISYYIIPLTVGIFLIINEVKLKVNKGYMEAISFCFKKAGSKLNLIIKDIINKKERQN